MQFILENILLFLPLGLTGVIATVILLFLPKKENIHTYEEVKSDVITIFKIRWNIYVLMYLFIWITMIFIGVLSTFYILTLISGIIAAVPLVLLIILEYRSNNQKVS